MTWLQFIASMTGSLAWPVVVAILIYLLRDQLASMADRLIELSIGGAKITLERKLKEGAQVLERVVPIMKDEKPAAREGDFFDAAHSKPTKQRMSPDEVAKPELFEEAPAWQILKAFERIEDALFAIADTLDFDPAEARSVMYTLIHHKLVNKETADLYASLSEVRALVAHGKTLPNEKEALEFVRQASRLEQVLRGVDINQIKATPKHG